MLQRAPDSPFEKLRIMNPKGDAEVNLNDISSISFKIAHSIPQTKLVITSQTNNIPVTTRHTRN